MSNGNAFQAAGMETPEEDLLALRLLTSLLPQAPTIIEVGSWTGRTALNFLAACPAARVYCVDTWEGSATDTSGRLAEDIGPEKLEGMFLDNCRPHLFKNIFPLKGTSIFWAKHWPLGPVDLVFLDGDHQLWAVKSDIRAWKPRVKEGGILCGHDYNEAMFPDVVRAVHEHCPGHQHAGRTLWFERL